MMEYKCIRCHLVKPVSEFYKDPRRKSGLHPYCKLCHKQVYLIRSNRCKKSKIKFKKIISKQCFRCKTHFDGCKDKKYCSNKCRYEAMSDRMKFEMEIGTGRYNKRARSTAILE